MIQTPHNFRPQFSLFGLLALTALLAVVFGLLAAMGTPAAAILIGFMIFGGLAGVIAVVIECFAQLIGARR